VTARTGGLLAASAPALNAAAQTSAAVTTLLAEVAAAVSRLAPSGWVGAGATAGSQARDVLGAELRRQGGATGAVSTSLRALALAVQEAQAQVAVGQGLAATAGLLLDDEGTPQPVRLPVEAGADLYAAGAGRAQVLAARARLDAVDAAVAHALTDLLGAGPEGGLTTGASAAADVLAAEMVPPVPVALVAGSSALQVGGWWAGLLPLQRAALLRGKPEALGDLQGLPIGARDAANRALLSQALQADEARLDQLGPHLLAHSGLGHNLLTAERRRVLAQQKALLGVQGAIAGPGRQLLRFDPRGDGRAEVAVGDVEHARALGLIVPGMSNELDEVPDIAADAATVQAAAGAGTAVVAWLGYDAPHVRQVASSDQAVAGARSLDADVRGLRAARTAGGGTPVGAQRITVVGHSYGSLVAGLAAGRRTPVDDVVVVGSPGVAARSARDLPQGASHVWAARAASDPIRFVFDAHRFGGVPGPLPRSHSWFGPDPSRASFGGQRFLVGPGVTGHVRYFEPGTESVANIGRIVAGRYAEVTH
jgi:hypothetical protein